MFEGVVSQVLDGLLRRYVKGIQKEQLKIGIWKEEILLENVELILEAFDYLQLPFALKNGRIGKLSIRIPWKKLGWDPIIIVIEDVFVCACPREDSEWSSDSLDKRELAGKLAKLNAIELAKFSRRVTDNQTGQSFLSYISAKILDSIQVSMRNVHIVYMDTHNGQGNFVFGLEFSSLSIQTDTQKQSFTISLMARSRQDEVNKIIEISDVGIYCHQLEEQQDLCHVGALENGHSRDDYLVNPFCVTVSVLANKAAKLDGTPQYDMTAELTALALSVDEIQLQQILNLCDYFTICALRTKYGRYRPSQSSLSKRCKGWQRMWWQYAQNSVSADVRRRLKKTSWRYFEQRLNHRLRYVKLYRMKLELLQKGQIVSEDILQELENMDKECDIDDILNYRTIAEQQLQVVDDSVRRMLRESLVKPSKDTHSPGSPRSEEQLTGASQGWLNWLSLGMLGVGGTADSSSFAGVISEDIIKDIYEGTEFHPVSSAENCLKKENYYSLFVRLSISQIVTTVTSRGFGMKLVDTVFSGLGMECKIWDDSATILAWLDSLQVINPLNETKILQAEKCSTGDGLGAPVISIQVDFPKSNERSQASTRVVVQEFNAIYEPEFFVNVLHIYDLFSSFQFQHDRVLSSLNRFNNLGTRLVSKLNVAPVHLELEERLVLSMIEFFRSVSSRINIGRLEKSLELSILGGATDMLREYEKISKNISDKLLVQDSELLPSVVPVGAPWQQIHLLARKQKKVYIELFQLTPVKLTFSFTSTPWLNRNEGGSDPSIGFNNTTAIQRGLIALLDVEGVPVYLGEITAENLMASWQSVQDILVRHYSRQILHELYKVLGSAGVIGNPMGFARNVGFGLKDFISASRKGKLQSPVELLNGIAQGSKTLIGSTVYAVSSATSHFSKTAYKGLVAFTYDEQAASKMEERERQLGLLGEGVLNGFLEGLTGLLQSPIRGAEKHGLPGVISGLAMGTAGLVARPMASILEATGRTAQSIRNRSNPHESNYLRVRFPRPVARDHPLFPYSWEEAIGVSLLAQADSGRLKEETFVMCKTLKGAGKFLVLTEKLLLLVSSPYLVDLGSPQFVGVPPDPQWSIDTEMHLKSVVHLDRSQEVVNIVGSNGQTSPRDKRGGTRNRVMSSAFVPLFHLSIELPNDEDAEGTVQVLQALIEKGKARRWDKNILHRSNIS